MFNQLSGTRSQYLDTVLKSYSMRHISELESAHRIKGNAVKDALRKQYGLYNPYNPMNSGSMAKATSINTKFDLDIIVPFPHQKFARLEDMAKEILRFFQQDYKRESGDQTPLSVRDQSWSIGLEFNMGNIWSPLWVKIDVVPGRELRNGAYISDYFLNLKNTSDGTWMQTNIQHQIDTIRNSHDSVRKVVRLLKIWKLSSGFSSLKSFVIELACIRAFADYPGEAPRGMWEQLKMVMEYIEKNFPNPLFRLIDPGNSGNNVMDTLEIYQRSRIASTLGQMVKSIEAWESSIRNYFPLNRQFPT